MTTNPPDRQRLYRTLFAPQRQIDFVIAEMAEEEKRAEHERPRRRWPWPVRALRELGSALNYYRKQF